MSTWRGMLAGVRSIFRKDDVERDLDDELRHYLDMAVQEHMRAGMSQSEAKRAALVQMGGIEATKTRVRTGSWVAGVDTLVQDVRVALRGLRHSRGFTILALTSLALGVGITTTMFSVMNAVMFRPLPYRDAGRIAMIWTDDARRNLHREGTAHLTVTDWQARSRAFQDIAYFTTGRVAPMSNDPGRGRGRSRNALVSANLFPVLGVAPLKGRLLSKQDEIERAPVVVISYGFWQRWLDGAPDIIGKSISFDNDAKGGLGTVTVIGVMPPDFYFPDKQTEIWTPATNYWRFARESGERFEPWSRRWTAVGRLAEGATVASARAELTNIGRQLGQVHTTSIPDFPGFGVTVTPVLDFIAGSGLQSALWILLGAVTLVLLVVCANVASLQLARGATRQREFAVRRALGAGRGHLIRQLGAETLLLVLAGGAMGTAIAAWGTPLLASAASAYVPRMDEVSLDGRVLAFAAIASIASGLVFGLLPVLRLSATDANEALREGGGARGTASRRLRRSQGAIVLAECALALVLLMGAGLLLRSLERLQSVDPGFDPRHVLMVRLEFAAAPPPTAAQRTQTSPSESGAARAREQLATSLTERVQAIRGVEAVGFMDDLFSTGQGNKSITIPGRSADEIAAGELNEGSVSPGFFAALRVPLRNGRYLVREDAEQKIRALWELLQTDLSLAEKERLAIPEPVVVNEAFVRRFFPGEDPIGKRFCIDPTNKTYWYTIVGVVGDMHRSGLERSAIPEYYGPHFPSPGSRADLLVRTSGDPLALAATIRGVVQGAIPDVRIDRISTAEEQLGDFSAQRRLQTWLLASFAGFALLLAAVGIFGLAHYAVAERTREIGVRVALGATPGDVLRLVISQGMLMPALGIAIGLVASVGLTRIIANQLYDVRATDPLTFMLVALVLALVAAAACYLAARRAARADPVQALRAD